MNFAWQGVYIIAADLLFANQYTNSVSNVVTGIESFSDRVGIFFQSCCSLLMTRVDSFVHAQAVGLFLFRQSSKKVVKLNLRDFTYIYISLNSRTPRGLDECGAMDSR